MGKGRYTVALYEFHVAFLNPINNPYPSLKKISIPLFSGTRVPGCGTLFEEPGCVRTFHPPRLPSNLCRSTAHEAPRTSKSSIARGVALVRAA